MLKIYATLLVNYFYFICIICLSLFYLDISYVGLASLSCLCQDLKSRRNPRLVPYALLDERTKKSNRDSLREAIRTMVGYGYDIDPPDQEGKNMMLSHKTFITPGFIYLAKLII